MLVKFDLEFDLQFEISDGNSLVKLGGRSFPPARKEREISGRISGLISEKIRRKFRNFVSRLFFGNFVQQKGGATLRY